MSKSAMLGAFEDTVAMSIAMEMVQPCIDFAHRIRASVLAT